VQWHEDEEAVGQLVAFEALDDLALGVDGFDVEEGVQLDAALLEDRPRHLSDRLDRAGAPDRRAEVHLGPVAKAAPPQLGLDQEGDVERRRRALPASAE